MVVDLEVEFLANEQRSIAESVLAALDEYTDAFFAVAYGMHSAFELIDAHEALSSFIKSGHRLRVFFDADRHFTDPDLINEIATYPGDVECRLFAPRARNAGDSNPPTAFHSKVYYFERKDGAAAVVGSANFSLGGLRSNSEAALLVRGDQDAPVFASIRRYLEEVWESPFQIGVLENSVFMDAYQKAYAAARRRTTKLPIPPEAPVYQNADDVAALQSAYVASSETLLHSIVAYIVGLISGGWQSENLRGRKVVVELRRGRLNRDQEHDGKVYFAEISERGLIQSDCVRRDVDRIVTRLQRAFEALESGDAVEIEKRTELSYRINMRFARKSPVWDAVAKELRGSPGNRRYIWPTNIDVDVDPAGRSFLQGYMDVRTRIAKTDSLPPPIPFMRVAISVGKHAKAEVPEKLRNLMARVFDCEAGKINLLKGPARNRESIIRVDARLIPANFLESHWQRIVVEDFREFNERLAEDQR